MFVIVNGFNLSCVMVFLLKLQKKIFIWIQPCAFFQPPRIFVKKNLNKFLLDLAPMFFFPASYDFFLITKKKYLNLVTMCFFSESYNFCYN